MARIVCQVLVHPSRITIRWSADGDSFAPYYLEGTALTQFWAAAEQARQQVRELAQIREQPAQNQAGLVLAQAGQRLFQQLLPSEQPWTERTGDIRSWLRQRYEVGEVDSLEILGDTAGQVPWNAVYEGSPDPAAFQSAEPHSPCWRGFWGIRYRLAVTPRVNPVRTLAVLPQPRVLLAVDGAVRSQLSAERRQQLQSLADSGKLMLVDSYAALKSAVQNEVPDILYLCGRQRGAEFLFGEAPLTPQELRQWILDSETRPAPWNNLIVVVNPCAAADSAGWPALRQKFLQQRFSGLIAPDEPLPADAASAFAVDFLERFVNKGDPVAEAAQNARAALAPAGLVYSTICPPQLQVSWAETTETSLDETEEQPLPEFPYKPLAPLDREDRALLIGREDDVAAFAALVDAPGIRLAVLQGRSGVGKSSLLRAGVLPVLDAATLGLSALRDRNESETGPLSEEQYPVLAIRCTNDLAGQLALVLCAHAATAYTYRTPTGQTIRVDLPGLLAGLVRGESAGAAPAAAITEKKRGDRKGTPAAAASVDAVQLRAALLERPSLLADILRSWGEQLPHELVLLIEQGEELYSLSRTSADVELRQKSLQLLRALVEAPGHSKAILSLRTEYAGRILHRLREDLADTAAIGEYLLSALRLDDLLAVVLLPTLVEPIPFSTQIPQEQYGFAYEEGVPDTIAREAMRAANQGQGEALPLVQVLCTELVARLVNRPTPVITAADLRAVGDATRAIPRLIEQQRRRPELRSVRLRLRFWLEELCLRHPDGLVSRNLVREKKLAGDLRGRRALDQALPILTTPEVHLLEEVLVVDEDGEHVAVSLSHDALVPAIALGGDTVRDSRRKAIADTLWIAIPLFILLAVAYTVFYWLPYYRNVQAQAAELGEIAAKQQIEVARGEEEQWPLFVGQMFQAQQAWQSGDLARTWQLLQDQKAPARADLRGFEWHYLWQLSHQARFTFPGLFSVVEAAAIAPNGKLLVTANGKGDAAFWSLESGRRLSELEGVHEGPIYSVAFSPAGDVLATAGADRQMKLWFFTRDAEGNPQELKKLTLVKGHTGAVRAVIFSPDKKTLLSAGDDQTIRIWEVQNEEAREKQQLKEHREPVHRLALSPDGKQLASVDARGKVLLWNLDKGQVEQTLDTAAEDAAFAPDGKTLATVGIARQWTATVGQIHFWKTDTGKETGKAITASKGLLRAAYLPDGKTLVTGGQDQKVVLWDVESGQARHEYRGHLGAVQALVIDKEGKNIVSGSKDSTINVWDANPPPRQWLAHEDGIESLALAPGDRLLATGGRDGKIKLWEVLTGKLLHTLDKHTGPVLALAFGTRDAQLLLASAGVGKDDAGQAFLWNVEKGEVHKELTGIGKTATCAAFAPNGETVAIGSTAGSVRTWKTDSGEKAREFPALTKAVRALVYSPEGQMLTGAGDEGIIYLWDARSGQALPAAPPKQMTFFTRKESKDALLQGHTAPILALSFLPEGQFLASASADHTIKVWNTHEQTEIMTFSGHAGEVQTVVFGPTGKWLASGSTDGTVRLWDILHGERFLFSEHTGNIRGVAFSRDRRMLISAGHDGRVQVRLAAPEEPRTIPKGHEQPPEQEEE